MTDVRLRRALPLLLLLLAAGCEPSAVPAAGIGTGAAQGPTVTRLSPEPGPFNEQVTVTLTTDSPATIFVTTDGQSPAAEGPGRLVGPSPLTLELTQTTTLTFFSRTEAGADEPVRSAQYVRAGGPSGTIRGVVVLDTLAVGRAVRLNVGLSGVDLGQRDTPGELPFELTDLQSGRYRLTALADRDDDGRFVPVLDLTSDTVAVELDLDDPFAASAEGVRLYLGASPPERCTLHGVVDLPGAKAGETLRISALSAADFGQGGSALFQALQQGDLLFARDDERSYPYLLPELEPGTYVPTPVLTSFGTGGIGFNVLGNPLDPVQCQAGSVVEQDLFFGPVALTGTVTLVPATPPQQPVWGIVAARSVSFTNGLQILLMPVLFSPSPASADLEGTYGSAHLWANASFALRVFTSADSQNPLGDALAWTVKVFGGAPAHGNFSTTTVDVNKDVVVTLP